MVWNKRIISMNVIWCQFCSLRIELFVYAICLLLKNICILNVGFSCFKRNWQRWVIYPLFFFLSFFWFFFLHGILLNSLIQFPVSIYMIEKLLKGALIRKFTSCCDINFVYTTRAKWEIKMFNMFTNIRWVSNKQYPLKASHHFILRSNKRRHLLSATTRKTAFIRNLIMV